MSNETINTEDKSLDQSVAHTPGPWKFHGGWGMCVTLDEPIPISGARSIANCSQSWISPSQCEANAKLIAAAPDLLAALQEIRGELCRRHSPMVVEMDYAYINNAINKAIGRVV
jgi:hypothetical protein